MPDSKLMLNTLSAELFDEYYRVFKENPDKLNETWRGFFSGIEFAMDQKLAASDDVVVANEFKVVNLIDAYRKRGHFFTQTNPVRARREYLPNLDIHNFGLVENDLDKAFEAGNIVGIGRSKLSDIISVLEKTYCSNIGVEYMYIRDTAVIEWLTENMESTRNTTVFSSEKLSEMYIAINKAVEFEQFLHKRFPGQKRFSLEGTEAIVPALKFLIEEAVLMGVEEIDIGMPHRGRLNVLTNIMNKPYESVFSEFLVKQYSDNDFLGDVKYHLGYNNHIEVGKQKLDMYLLPNPSHLEAVDGVLEGFARGHIDKKFNGDNKKLIPVLIHGDAAVAAQGIVYEVLQMSQLPAYKTGGTIHLIINNQIGFTTNYLDARSSTYCTDIGKVTRCPIFHVNSDDPESLVHVVELAVRYRQRFHTDVFIDVLGYRKYGHNEGDEPRFTQPTLYKAIAAHSDVKILFRDKLLKQASVSQKYISDEDEKFNALLESSYELAKKKSDLNFFSFISDEEESSRLPIKINAEQLKSLAQTIFSLPHDKEFIPKAVKISEVRLQKLEENVFDWGMGELLAYMVIVGSGKNVRLSGQDSVRGTFSHRHAAFFVNDTDTQYSPLSKISTATSQFAVWNSLLSEYGVLGFEYGYALANRDALVIWEAQFGDFNNVAQVIIDQYITSAEAKWGLKNGLVLYLPHGYEGQGPEHSSARIERFLQLAVNENIKVVQPTTPANLFHLLVNHAAAPDKPMIVFTPKSLLRHPMVISQMNDFTEGTFKPLVYRMSESPELIKTIILCSGKIYYDLISKQAEINDVSRLIIAIEQLHPFPKNIISDILKFYKNTVSIVWVQEEPINMGAAYYVHREMNEHTIRIVARPASSSIAVGLIEQHLKQQNKLVDKAFGFCTCVRRYDFCDLQCSKFDNNTHYEN